MKKKGVIFAFLISLIFLISFLAAAENQTGDASTKAYACLENKVKDKCSSLTTEEKIFSLLTIERCKTEVMSDSLNEECWPNGGCKIKTTAQAILALRHVNANTVKAENWLLGKTSIVSNIDWFLQVESENATSCTASYDEGSYKFSLNEDKTLTGSAGSCLKLYNKYWLKISSACYDKELSISCENSFLTSLLYRKTDSPTIYVSEKTESSSGEGTTTEKIASSCFKDGSACSYEGTLWASLALKTRGHDVSSYIPYLVSMADSNEKYLPEAFLYFLTNNFRTDLLVLQKEDKWWTASGEKFYDTAVALLPFQNEQLTEKTNAIGWLEEVQGTDGCWQGNIRNTAFLLYSIWPKQTAAPNITMKDCEDSGFSCMSSAACTSAEGDVLTDYSGCFTDACCSKKKEIQTCSQQGGEICDSDEDCLGGDTVSASDATSGKSCCIDGDCGEQEQASECDLSGGVCKSSCSGTEEFSSYSCTSPYMCCVTKASTGGGSIWLVIVLIILIILTLIGIIFRKKLKELLFRIKSKFGKNKGRPVSPFGGPRFPPTSSSRIYPGGVQRRIMVPRRLVSQPSTTPVKKTTVPVKRAPAKKSDFDDILKKLKEIGKS